MFGISSVFPLQKRDKRTKSIYVKGQKEPQSQKIARTVPKTFLNDSRALPNKIKAMREIAPESSPKSSTKSLSLKLFGVLFGLWLWGVGVGWGPKSEALKIHELTLVMS